MAVPHLLGEGVCPTGPTLQAPLAAGSCSRCWCWDVSDVLGVPAPLPGLPACTLPIAQACTGLSGFLLQTVQVQTAVKFQPSKMHTSASKFQMWGAQVNQFILFAEARGLGATRCRYRRSPDNGVPLCSLVLAKSQVHSLFSNFPLREQMSQSFLYRRSNRVIFNQIL